MPPDIDEVIEPERTQAEEFAAEAVKELRADPDHKSVTMSYVVEPGDPKRMLVHHAEEFGPTAFSRARQVSAIASNALFWVVFRQQWRQAHCSVEVARGQHP